MAHGSNNEGTQRESTSLYRSTEGVDPRPAGISNLSLHNRKNNPGVAGPVKHSDFFVQSIDGLSTSKAKESDQKLYLKRGETVVITVQFTGAAIGFLQESRFTPQNFEWVVSDSAKLTILETSSTSGVYTDGSHRAYKITLKNTWNECSDIEVDEHITCKFKDNFNNNLDFNHGYDKTFKVDLKLRGISLENVADMLANGNNQPGFAYDNNLYPADETGKNYSPDQYTSNGGSGGLKLMWQDRRAKDGRTITTYKPRVDAQEIVIRSTLRDRSGWDHSPGFETSDGIYKVIYQWQKKINSSWKPVVNEYSENSYFNGLHINGVPHGNFEASKVSEQEKRLNIQGYQGTGEYRLSTTVTGDASHPWTCTYISNSVNVTIHKTINRVTLTGAAYSCANGSPQHSTMTATAQRDYSGSITFQLWKRNPTSVTTEVLVEEQTTTGNSVTFNVSNNHGDGYFMVKAAYTNAHTGVRALGGEKWSDTTIQVPADIRSNGSTTPSHWYDRTSIMRRILQPPQMPSITINNREGVHRNIITFTVASPSGLSEMPPYHVYDDVIWKIDATDVSGNKTTPFDWQPIDLAGKPSKTQKRTCPIGVTIDLYAKLTVTGEMPRDDIASGQPNAICSGPVASDQTYTINCAQTCFIAPDGEVIPQGYSGDVDTILWEDRDLKDENRAEEIVRPEGGHLKINERKGDPNGPSVKVTNTTNAMASSIIIHEEGQADKTETLQGTQIKTLNFNSPSNRWRLSIKNVFGYTTPSNITYPDRIHERRINK